MTPREPAASSLTLFGSQVKYWVYHPEQARTILMVHGFRGNHLGLKYIIARLPGYRIVMPDLPGFGESEPMTTRAHDIAGYSDFIREFTNAVGLINPVLLGHSFGTIIATHVAAREPARYAKLILMNPIAISPRSGLQAPVTKLVEAYYWLGTTTPDAWSRRILGSRTFSRLMSLSLSRTRDPELRRLVYTHHLEDLSQPQRRKVIAESFAASITKTALDDAAHITQETLIIAGQLDPIAPPPAQARLQRTITGSRLIYLPKVGHLVHLETPAPAAEAIASFIG